MKVLCLPTWREGCLLARGVDPELSREGREDILYLKPCASKGELMAEIDLGGKGARPLDPHLLCHLLEKARPWFSEVKCSPTLRAARFRWGIAEVSIFGDGGVKIRRALDHEEVSHLSSLLARLLWGAMRCEVCGLPALRCASGGCRCAGEGRREVAVDDPLLLAALSSLERIREVMGTEREELLREAERQILLFILKARKEEVPLALFLLAGIEERKDTPKP